MAMNYNKFNQPETSKYVFVLVAAIALLIGSFYFSNEAIARPTGATTSPGTDNYGPGTGTASFDPARGGVITELTLNGTVQTNNWQGYYGFVGSYIVLADSTANYMYSWNVTSPNGSVIASQNQSINLTGLSNQSTCTVYDSIVGDAVSDKPSATFSNGAHTSVDIGNTSITDNTCTTDLFVNNISNTSWEENMLTDGDNNFVFQVFIQPYGNEIFNGVNRNFQIMLPEDEAGSAGTTNYYFWLELI